MVAIGSDVDYTCPVFDTALSQTIVSYGDHGAVGLKAYGMALACCDLYYVRPTADIALTVVVVSDCDHSAVGP
jgi:hypothetical protein